MSLQCTNCGVEFCESTKFVKCPGSHIYCSKNGCCDFLFKVNFRVAYQKHENFGTIERNDCRVCIEHTEDRIDELREKFDHRVSLEFICLEEEIEHLIDNVRDKKNGCDDPFWALVELHDKQTNTLKNKK